MNKTFIASLSLSLLITVSTSAVNAQENAFASNHTTSGVNYTNPQTEGKEIDIKDVNSNALTDFRKKFSDAADASWTTTGKLTSVYFKKDGLDMRCTYNEKGRLEYTIRYYIGAQVPKNIINLMRKNDYYMDVVQVTEVQRGHKTTQFVQMEDASSYITVAVHDGELAVHEMRYKQ